MVSLASAKNVDMEMEGDILVIRINMTQTQGKSSTGKSTIIATTAGNKPVPGWNDCFLGLNIFKRD